MGSGRVDFLRQLLQTFIFKSCSQLDTFIINSVLSIIDLAKTELLSSQIPVYFHTHDAICQAVDQAYLDNMESPLDISPLRRLIQYDVRMPYSFDMY